MLSTFNLVTAEHMTNVATDVSNGNTEFYASESTSLSTETTIEDDAETVISDGDTTITATSETDYSASTEITTTTTSA